MFGFKKKFKALENRLDAITIQLANFDERLEQLDRDIRHTYRLLGSKQENIDDLKARIIDLDVGQSAMSLEFEAWADVLRPIEKTLLGANSKFRIDSRGRILNLLVA